MKSTVDEIRARFDADVERFSNLDSGQSATMDAPLVMDLVARAAAAATPRAVRLLDVGCGAGNYSIKIIEHLPGLEVDLVDLSLPMLERAAERLGAVTDGRVVTNQADIREFRLERERYDVIVAAATLHHLRSEAEWEALFHAFYEGLRPGGSIWISDLVEHTIPGVQELMWARYGDYLTALGGVAYRDGVFAYIAREDSPRPLVYQLDLLRGAGFEEIEVLHKNGCFAAFGGRKRAISREADRQQSATLPRSGAR